jgi:hypothetical protein
MTSYDEDLQQEFENGGRPRSEGLDARAYEEVFRALGKDPGYQVSSTFAEKVVSRVIARQQAKESKDYFWFAAGLVFLLLSAVATIMLTGFRLDFGFLSVMSDYKGLAGFGILFVLLLHWLDKRVVRKHSAY